MSEEQQLSYLALGDSYTIGESVQETMRWPVQLTDQLNSKGIPVESPRIIATTGWTTDELIGAVAAANIDRTYDLVSLLIGVNNQYRGYEFKLYEKEFENLLQTSIKLASDNSDRVFVVSIPDYGVTPFGQKKNPTEIASEIDIYNKKASEIAETYGVVFINITDISKLALGDETLVSGDGLHPSGKMYSQWVERILPQVEALIK